jgi:hypothetical protein
MSIQANFQGEGETFEAPGVVNLSKPDARSCIMPTLTNQCNFSGPVDLQQSKNDRAP